jgi:opacity protein-like surface antigen
MGWNAGVTGTHMVNTNWGFGGDVNYHSWNGSEDANTAAELAFGPGSEYSWSAVQATAHGVYRFPTNSNVRPYAKFGTGIYNVKLALDSPSGDAEASESNLGFNFGGGMNFATSSNMMWGVNAAYHLIQADGGDINEFSLGMNLLWGVGGR